MQYNVPSEFRRAALASALPFFLRQTSAFYGARNGGGRIVRPRLRRARTHHLWAWPRFLLHKLAGRAIVTVSSFARRVGRVPSA